MIENKEHTILCIAGKTSSGKDTLVDKLSERTGAKQLISYTTRERRSGEGDTHIFVTDNDFEQMLADNQVAAYTEINNAKYWCTINQLYKNQLYIIDPQGIKVLKNLNLPNLKFVVVYIHAPDKLREYRALKLRGDDKTTFKSRNLSEREQFREFERNLSYDYMITNVEFAKAFSVLKWIYDVEGIWKNKEGE